MNPSPDRRVLPVRHAIVIFSLATAYFVLLLFSVLPAAQSLDSLHPVVSWYITGYFLFIPLLAFALLAVRSEGNASASQMARALSVQSMSRRDWTYAIALSILSFLCTGVIFGASALMNKLIGLRELQAEPWFLHSHPFEGWEKLLLLVWLPMFFLNIAGEELLWRGYVQSRITARHSWIVCALLWLCFHLPFGIDLIIVLSPFMFIVTYAFHKTHNTMVTMFIHALYNGPTFILVSLGAFK